MTRVNDIALERRLATGPIELTLPMLPPSTNALFANVRGKGRVRTAEYNRWLNQAGMLLRSQCKTQMAARCEITIALEDCHPHADCSNFIKPVEDLLVKVGILWDDSAAYVRSAKAEWTADIAGLRITIIPSPPHVAKQGSGE